MLIFSASINTKVFSSLVDYQKKVLFSKFEKLLIFTDSAFAFYTFSFILFQI